MTDLSKDAQRIVINALKASSDIVSLVGNKVYDYMPIQAKGADLPYPFIMVGEIDTSDWGVGGDCLDGSKSVMTIRGFSNHRGKEVILDIGKAISETLKNTKTDTENIVKVVNSQWIKANYYYADDDRLLHVAKVFHELTLSI